MIADQNFYGTCFIIFYPTASATVYGRRPKFFRAEHSATAEGENCAYGPTLEPKYLYYMFCDQKSTARSAHIKTDHQIFDICNKHLSLLYFWQ